MLCSGMFLALCAAPMDAQQPYGAGARTRQSAASNTTQTRARPVSVEPGALPIAKPASLPRPNDSRVVPASYQDGPDVVVPGVPAVPPIPAVPTPSVPPAAPTEVSANPVPPRVVPVPSTLPSPSKDLGPEVTRLPPRSSIFTIYEDDVLEQKIYESIAKQLGKSPEELRKSTPFPPLKPLVPPGTTYVAKTAKLEPGVVVYEPGFIVHNRLLFEERNSERYGWDLGLAQPFVSTMSFYKNVLMWPHNAASSLVVGRMDTNAGKCLPGSPTPYYLYPQGLTITGGVAEGLVITGLAFVIP